MNYRSPQLLSLAKLAPHEGRALIAALGANAAQAKASSHATEG